MISKETSLYSSTSSEREREREEKRREEREIEREREIFEVLAGTLMEIPLFYDVTLH
jgi:protein subunit release factor B